MQYTLRYPLIISSRLMPAIKVGDGTIHMAADRIDGDRVYWRYIIDGPDFTHEAADLRSPAGDARDLDQAVRRSMGSLLSFLGHAAETDETVFSREVDEWAAQYSDEIALAAMELEPDE